MKAFCLINGKLYLVRWLVLKPGGVTDVQLRTVEAKSKHQAIFKVIDLEIEKAHKGE